MAEFVTDSSSSAQTPEEKVKAEDILQLWNNTVT
jgi:hypothetical protein